MDGGESFAAHALPDPYVNLTAHTAPRVQPFASKRTKYEQMQCKFHESGKPEPRLPGSSLEAFILQHHPADEMSVDQAKRRIERRFVEALEVPNLRFKLPIEHAGQINKPLLAKYPLSPFTHPASEGLELY